MGRSERWGPGRVLIALAGLVGALLILASVLIAVGKGMGPALAAIDLAVVGMILLAGFVSTELLIRLAKSVSGQIAKAKGIAVVDALPPGEVMQRLLERVFGEHPANEHITRSLLGGAGRDTAGADLSIAGPTTVHYHLRSIQPGICALTSTVSYTFPRPVTDLNMTIFSTSDARLRDVIVAACDRPIFDWVYFADSEQWRAVDSELADFELSIHFVDTTGAEHTTDLEPATPAWVPLDQWPDHLSLFRQSSQSIDRQDPADYLQSLKVFSIDLEALAPDGFSPASIKGLTQRHRTIHPDVGNTFWQPNFPCLLDTVTIDVSDFAEVDGVAREFDLQPFLTKTAGVDEAKSWVRAEEIPVLKVGAWTLPGHGFILLWRMAGQLDDGTQQ